MTKNAFQLNLNPNTFKTSRCLRISTYLSYQPHTVCEFKIFSIVHILREINLVFYTEALDLGFGQFLVEICFFFLELGEFLSVLGGVVDSV